MSDYIDILTSFNIYFVFGYACFVCVMCMLYGYYLAFCGFFGTSFLVKTGWLATLYWLVWSQKQAIWLF